MKKLFFRIKLCFKIFIIIYNKLKYNKHFLDNKTDTLKIDLSIKLLSDSEYISFTIKNENDFIKIDK
jgi:hypothetical protein